MFEASRTKTISPSVNIMVVHESRLLACWGTIQPRQQRLLMSLSMPFPLTTALPQSLQVRALSIITTTVNSNAGIHVSDALPAASCSRRLFQLHLCCWYGVGGWCIYREMRWRKVHKCHQPHYALWVWWWITIYM